ncbi:hypothetical protein ACSZM7_10590 [Aeromonas veronii]
MSEHTQEPWVLFEVGDHHVHLCPASAANKTSILTVTEEDGVTFAAVYSDDDARRIVACVNACRGLPTDVLEQKWLLAAVGTLMLEADQQRDELLAEKKDHQRLVRELDVLLNGVDGAAHQASLCDLVAQLKSKGGAA